MPLFTFLRNSVVSSSTLCTPMVCTMTLINGQKTLIHTAQVWPMVRKEQKEALCMKSSIRLLISLRWMQTPETWNPKTPKSSQSAVNIALTASRFTAHINTSLMPDCFLTSISLWQMRLLIPAWLKKVSTAMHFPCRGLSRFSAERSKLWSTIWMARRKTVKLRASLVQVNLNA